MDKSVYRIAPNINLRNQESISTIRRSKCSEDYCFFFIFRLFGIDLFSKKNRRRNRCSFRTVLPVILVHLIYIDGMLTNTFLLTVTTEVQLVISRLINVTLMMMLWYIIMFKEYKIRLCLQSFSSLLPVKARRKCSCINTRIFLILLYFIPFVYGAVAIYVTEDDRLKYLYFWKIKNVTTTIRGFRYLEEFGTSIMAHVFCGLVTLLYSSKCRHIIQSLTVYREIINISLKENKSSFLSTSFLRSYLKTLDVIENIDEVFTVPIFVLTASNGSSLFTLMAVAFMTQSTGMSHYIMLQVIMYVSTSGVYMITTIIVASQIPLEVEDNVKYFNKLHEKVILEPSIYYADEIQLTLIKSIIKRPIITLSGCHIIYFTRHMLISIIGALITYGLLIMQIK